MKTTREDRHRLEKAKRFGRMFGAGPIAIRAHFMRAAAPKPKTTPCVGCGRRRFTGWFLKRCGFSLPMCSACTQNLLHATYHPAKGRVIRPFPNVLKVKFHGVLWTVDQGTK